MSDAFDAEPLPPPDARLLADLGQAIDHDDPPSGLIDRTIGLFDLMNLDRQLAELLDDPAVELAGTRGHLVVSQRLSFRVGDGSVALELVVLRDRLAGQVLAGELSEIVLERAGDDERMARVDEFGRFTFDRQPRSPAGPFRLRLSTERPTGTGQVTTDWFVL